MKFKRICVFCGSSHGDRPEFSRIARETGTLLAGRGIGLVYGGGGVGLMSEVANGALLAGGEVTGVIPDALVAREVAHPRVSDLRVVRTMHERKALMVELSDAFMALPGGFGTMDEFFEIVTWAQLGMHRKPCGVLNVAGFYDSLLDFLDHAVRERLVQSEHRRMILVEKDPAKLLERFAVYVAPEIPKWIGRAKI